MTTTAKTARTPNFFIVGAPKCGTTALAAFLRDHPQVFMPRRKEPNFFNKDHDAPYPYCIRDRQEYLSLFEPARAETRLGEASVWYLMSQRAAAEIHAFRPDARIIIMLREPVEMIYSLHSQRLYTANENIADFAEAIDAEADRKLGRRIPRGVNLVEALFYRDVARYAAQVERYFELFGREHVQVILYDDLSADPAAVFRSTCAFLGVDPEFQPELRRHNPNRRIHNVLLHHFLHRPPEAFRQLGRTFVPRVVRRPLWRFVRSFDRFAISETPRVSMEPALRARLRAELADDVRSLARLIDRDLGPWLDSGGDAR